MHLAKRLELSRLCESNVPDDERGLKKKPQGICAEAVEEGEMLWKVSENRKKNPPQWHGGTEKTKNC